MTMASAFVINPEYTKEQTAMELTSYLMHKHYCENDVEAIIELMDRQIHWFGAGEEEYAQGKDTVAAIFRQFTGKVPKCTISEEEYQVLEMEPGNCLCTGRMWIQTDPTTGVYLRVHQRVTMGFRWVEGKPRCYHIHISICGNGQRRRRISYGGCQADPRIHGRADCGPEKADRGSDRRAVQHLQYDPLRNCAA